MKKITITHAGLSDLADIHAIEEEAYPAALAESAEVLGSRIHVASAFCAVALQEDQHVGYVLAHPWTDQSSPGLGRVITKLPPDASVIHIHDLAVLPKMRGAGVARSMLTWLEQRVEEHGFEAMTLVAVNGADTFWRTMGFEDIGPADGYDLQARMMRRILPGK